MKDDLQNAPALGLYLALIWIAIYVFPRALFERALSDYVVEFREAWTAIKYRKHPECNNCGAPNGERRRQRTCYVDEESNYATLCPACHEVNDEHWDEMWRDYYSGLL